MKGFLEWLKFLKDVLPMILTMLVSTLIFGIMAIACGLLHGPVFFTIGFCVVAVAIDWFGISILSKVAKFDTAPKVIVMDASGPRPKKPSQEVIIRETIYVAEENCFIVVGFE